MQKMQEKGASRPVSGIVPLWSQKGILEAKEGTRSVEWYLLKFTSK